MIYECSGISASPVSIVDSRFMSTVMVDDATEPMESVVKAL